MENFNSEQEYSLQKGPIWMDKILPHEEYFDANVSPLGIFREGPFCHLQKREIDIAGNKYNSCEQFIQAKKAMLFGDMKTWNKIMKETNPKVMKQRAKEIKNVQEEVWNEAIFDIYTQANYHKYKQNTDLKVLLLSTGSKLLVQCHDIAKPPRIGFSRSKSDRRILNEKLAQNTQSILQDRKSSNMYSSDPYLDRIRENAVQDIRYWDKKNIIGQSLMEVRKRLMNEDLERKARLLEAMNLHKQLDRNK